MTIYEAPAIVAVTELEGMLAKRISFFCDKDVCEIN